MDPELATLTKDRFSDPAWIFERKLDGERCVAYVAGDGEARLMSRSQHQVTSTFPEIEDIQWEGMDIPLDQLRARFEQLQQRLGVARPGPDLLAAVPVYFYLFDVLHAGGRDVRPLPLMERKDVLRGLFPFDDPLRYTEHRDTEGEAFYREACRNGWEGLVAKRADAPYHGGRLLGYYDTDGQLVYAGKVGTGFDQRLLRSLHKSMVALERSSPAFDRGVLPRSRVHWIEPTLVGQVGFSEWTRDGQLRHPRFQGLRRDKDPAEVVREVPSSAGPSS